jgi:hypothetical protein
MRGVVVELPAAAKHRLDELVLMRDAALDASRSAASRANNLPADASALRERLRSERDKAAERHRQLAMLTSKINQWHVELRLPPGTSLELQPPLNIAPKAGETAAQAIVQVRDEIAELKGQIAAVRSAPLKTVSQMEAIAIYLDRLVSRAKPRVGFDVKGNARVLWTEDLVASKDDLLGVLAFILGPEQIAAAFARDLCDASEDEREDAVTPIEREEKIAELAAALLRLERKERALLDLDDGLLPRPDMDPRAYLGVRIAQAQAQAAQVA